MRRSVTKPLGELIQEYLDIVDVHKQRKQARLINIWPEVVGTAVANRTTDLKIRNRVLYVSLNSSVARNEMTMIREKIRKALNDNVGEELIEKIVIQ